MRIAPTDGRLLDATPSEAFSAATVAKFYAARLEALSQSRPIAALTYRLASEAADEIADAYEQHWFRLEMEAA